MVAVLFSLLFWSAGPWIIQLLTNIEAVQNAANNYLIWLIFMPILAFGCYLFDGVYIGAAHGNIMRNSMIIATFGVYFPSWYLLQDWGNHSLWAAMSIFMLCRSVTLGWHYYYKLRYQLAAV
jgi:MATE family multidrug resistance protein